MATPAIPQKEPQDSKDAKGAVMRESLITTLKKGYEATKNPPKNPKPKRASLINDSFTNATSSYEMWKYPS